MKPEMILQADVLDIIFDNRNKEYGAYELRSHYEQRLKKSILIVFFTICLIIGTCILIGHFFPASKKVFALVSPDIHILDMGKTEDVKTEIKPKEKMQPERKIAQAINSKPVITRANVVKPIATQQDLADKMISDKTMDGDKIKTGDLIRPNGDGKGSAPETQSQAANEGNVVIEHPDFMPEFPGGIEALQRFLSRNLKMPREDLEPGTKIPTLVRFVVDKDGTITGIEFEKSGGKDFDNEVSRVMRKMPQWKPGRQNGKNVAVYFKLPVIFQVPDEN